MLITLLKDVYIKLYTDKSYIEKFDLCIIYNIKTAYREENCVFTVNKKGRVFIINNNKYNITSITPLLGNNNTHIQNAYKSLYKS